MAEKWLHRFELKPGRWVFQPSPAARVQGSKIKTQVEQHWRPPIYYFHLRNGGHLAALRRHRRSQFFLRVDIADFFGATSRSRVSRVLKEYFGHAEALRVATASTVHHPGEPSKRILPYGFVQSPLLASLALHKSSLGAYLDELRRGLKLVVTVYMDDIIVSGNEIEVLRDVLAELKRRATRSRFLLNDAKEQGPAPALTAFNIELSVGGGLVVLPTRMEDFIREFHSSSSEAKRQGIRGYVESVNPAQLGSFPP